MNKAVLNLNSTVFENYQHLDLEKHWRSVKAINVWLMARDFNLSLPIFVTKDDFDNTLTFFQSKSVANKTIILVHPNPAKLSQLYTSLKNAGHLVHAFSKVRAANNKIKGMSKIDSIVVPKNLKVHNGFTYKTYLNAKYPGYKVHTIDNNDYRDTLNGF